MKITRVETLQADAGWRMFSFLKITTDDGMVGWSEFNESFGSTGLSDVICGLAPVLIGRDPRMFEQVTQQLALVSLTSPVAWRAQSTGARRDRKRASGCHGQGIWRASIDALFGGPIRDRIPVYWSHFGTYRVRSAALMGVPSLSNYDDLARHAEEVKQLGFRALKTNIMPLNGGSLTSFVPGFGRTLRRWPELNCGITSSLGA